MIATFDAGNFIALCHTLAERDPLLGRIIEEVGYPPLWSRPVHFSTLVHIILEQQVSLASAMAAYSRLLERCGAITPDTIMQLTDADLRACYFSRQKTVYVRSLSQAFLSGKIDLEKLAVQTDEEVKSVLKQVKGIGDWTSDVFLIFALHRADVFPGGDLALVNAFRLLLQLPPETRREEIVAMAGAWAPLRSIGALLLWHFYIRRRNISVSPAMFSSALILSAPPQ